MNINYGPKDLEDDEEETSDEAADEE